MAPASNHEANMVTALFPWRWCSRRCHPFYRAAERYGYASEDDYGSEEDYGDDDHSYGDGSYDEDCQ